MNKRTIIKRIDSNNSARIYLSLKEAALDVDTTMEGWKVQTIIANAVNNNKRAFGYSWRKELI